MTFSTRLRALLKEYDYTQSAFAEIIGVTQQQVSRWVNGQFQPDLGQLTKCSNALHVSIDYLLGLSDERSSQNKKPTVVSDDELRSQAISRVQSLSDPALVRVLDFLSGLEAGQEIGATVPTDHDPTSVSSE